VDRDLLRLTGITGIAALIAVTILFLFVDRYVSVSAHMLKDGIVFKIAEITSLFGDHNLYNVLISMGFISGGILALYRGLTPGVRALLYVCVTVSSVMILGETFKWVFGRYRPVMHFEHALYGFQWFSSQGKMHSLPSGHSFRVFSAMTALGLVLPRWRVLFLTLAALVAISRVVVTRHFPSDVVAGAYLGIFAALWVWRIIQGQKPHEINGV